MAYPPAPWKLKGHAVLTLRLVDTVRVRRFVPAHLKIVSVLPGKTLGGVYLASYGSDSVLEYNELIVVAAFTRYASAVGFWISHIYVDNADSMAGGREIWGLPKELAEFTWHKDKKSHVVVSQQGQLLCTLGYGHRYRLWPQRFTMPSLSLLGPDLLFSKAHIAARLGLSRCKLAVPSESLLAPLGLGRGRLAYHCAEMTFVASVPEKVGGNG